jgi:hypothetical protein
MITIFRLTIDGQRSYPRTLEQALKLVGVVRLIKPDVHVTLARIVYPGLN